MKRRSFLQMLAALAGIPFLPRTAAKPVGQNSLAGPFCPPGFQGPIGPASLGVPVGTIQPYMGKHAPLGWLQCDGRVISAHEFPALHAVIGKPGKIPFALPEMRPNLGLGVSHQQGFQPYSDFTTLQYIIKT
jgi:hypothetical protein